MIPMKHWLLGSLLMLGVHCAAFSDPALESLSGIPDGLAEAQLETGRLVNADILIDRTTPFDHAASCSVEPGGRRRITVYLQHILATAQDARDARLRVAEAIAHEAAHAALECSNGDHTQIGDP